MLTRNDCLLLLSELETFDNVDKEKLKQITLKTASQLNISLDTLKFINTYKPLDVKNFYNQIRQNYNNKKSKLYINIVKEIDDTNKVLTTLSSLLTQILLYSENTEKCDNKQLFLQHSRAKEISLALTKYFENYDITICLQLLRLIKADIKSLEQLQNS
nr:MAG TPA: hypothetical protein [Caudoviricetes sp.]